MDELNHAATQKNRWICFDEDGLLSRLKGRRNHKERRDKC